MAAMVVMAELKEMATIDAYAVMALITVMISLISLTCLKGLTI